MLELALVDASSACCCCCCCGCCCCVCRSGGGKANEADAIEGVNRLWTLDRLDVGADVVVWSLSRMFVGGMIGPVVGVRDGDGGVEKIRRWRRLVPGRLVSNKKDGVRMKKMSVNEQGETESSMRKGIQKAVTRMADDETEILMNDIGSVNPM